MADALDSKSSGNYFPCGFDPHLQHHRAACGCRQKRLAKAPKVYFADVGTLCFLAGLKDPEHAASGPLADALMETAVLSEIVKTLTHRGSDPRVYFWRTAAGTEVDFIVDIGGKPAPLEVKLSATPNPAMAASVKSFQRDMGDAALPFADL